MKRPNQKQILRVKTVTFRRRMANSPANVFCYNLNLLAKVYFSKSLVMLIWSGGRIGLPQGAGTKAPESTVVKRESGKTQSQDWPWMIQGVSNCWLLVSWGLGVNDTHHPRTEEKCEATVGDRKTLKGELHRSRQSQEQDFTPSPQGELEE